MPVPSKEELDRDMQEWWDKLQARPREAPRQRAEVQVETKTYVYREGDKQPSPSEPTAPTLDA